MRPVTRNRVQDLRASLHEWHRYVDQLKTQSTEVIPNLSDDQPETIAAARDLTKDLAAFNIAAPHLNEWLKDPDNDIPNELMIELGRIAIERRRRNGMSFDAAVKRKTHAGLRDFIVSVKDAIPHVKDRRVRDDELPMLLEDLLDPSLKTARGSTMEATLRTLESVLSGARSDHPSIANAETKVRSLLR